MRLHTLAHLRAVYGVNVRLHRRGDAGGLAKGHAHQLNAHGALRRKRGRGAAACHQQIVHLARLLAQGDPDCQILALMEDGLLEAAVWLPTALFAAALWDYDVPFPRLLAENARRPDVVFANPPAVCPV